jgi:trehalose 6-phosphate synthase/phosphatase
MSSFRNHRVVIASLFLPSTAVLGDSNPPTPDHNDKDPSRPMLPNAFPVVSEIPQGYRSAPHHSRISSLSTPLDSIVEDLKDKVIFTSRSCESGLKLLCV